MLPAQRIKLEKFCYGRVNPSDSPKINLNWRDGPSGHDGNFFGIIPPPLGVATVVPVNFAQKSLRIKLDSCKQCTTIVQRSTEEWLARKGLIFY